MAGTTGVAGASGGGEACPCLFAISVLCLCPELLCALILYCIQGKPQVLSVIVLITHTYVHTQALSCPRVYSHTGVIMPARICTHKRDHAHTYVEIDAIVLTHVCRHKLDHAHIGVVIPVRMLDEAQVFPQCM